MGGSRSARPVWLWAYALAYAALACVLGVGLYQRVIRPVLVAEPVRVEHLGEQPGGGKVESRLDINTAAWYDLARLPGLGERLAKRIVAHRAAKHEQWQKQHPETDADLAPPAFQRPEDLLEVKGIGPKLLRKIRPYLLFDERPAAATQP